MLAGLGPILIGLRPVASHIRSGLTDIGLDFNFILEDIPVSDMLNSKN